MTPTLGSTGSIREVEALYGDSVVIRKRVRELREQGTEIRVLADRLVAHVEGIDWHGRAADALRDRVRDRATHLRDIANRHDTAADALERHGTEVDRLKDAIAETERKADGLVTDARARIAEIESHTDDPSGVRRTPTPEDETLAAFDPPPTGHRDWLTVSLPGLT